MKSGISVSISVLSKTINFKSLKSVKNFIAISLFSALLAPSANAQLSQFPSGESILCAAKITFANIPVISPLVENSSKNIWKTLRPMGVNSLLVFAMSSSENAGSLVVNTLYAQSSKAPFWIKMDIQKSNKPIKEFKVTIEDMTTKTYGMSHRKIEMEVESRTKSSVSIENMRGQVLTVECQMNFQNIPGI